MLHEEPKDDTHMSVVHVAVNLNFSLFLIIIFFFTNGIV